MPALESTAVILLAAITMAISSLATALLPDATLDASMGAPPVVVTELPAANTASVTVSVSVMDNGKLMSYCLAGALGGGIISVLIWPLPTAKGLAAKFVASSMAAVLWAPMTAQWLGWLTADYLLAVSGGVAVVSWTVLQTALPILTRFSGWFMERKASQYLPQDERK